MTTVEDLLGIAPAPKPHQLSETEKADQIGRDIHSLARLGWSRQKTLDHLEEQMKFYQIEDHQILVDIYDKLVEASRSRAARNAPTLAEFISIIERILKS